MKTFLFLCLSLTSSIVARGDELLLRHSTTFYGKEYVADLMESDLLNIQLWMDSENPPLSPKRAESIALDYAKMRFTPGTWTTSSLCLKNLGQQRWIYIVEMNPPIPGGVLDGLLLPVRVVVLMNGKPLTLKAKPSNRP